MVKWLKIDKTRQDEATPSRRSRQVAIYYISKQAIIIGDERENASRCRTTFSCSLGKTETETMPKYAA